MAASFATPSSTASPSPSPSRMWSSLPPSTAPSSPPPESGKTTPKSESDENSNPFLSATSGVPETQAEADDDGLTEDRYTRLKSILDRSVAYSALLKQQMEDVRRRTAEEERAKRPTKRVRRGRQSTTVTEEVEQQTPNENVVQQPALVTGGRLKDYQLEGLAWMIGLHSQGISGILADEMGLGKTLQTIAFTAYLREKITRPILIVCPLSVMHNWISEYNRFAPKIPVLMYHGTPDDRAEMRKTYLSLPEDYPPKGRAHNVAPPPPKKGKGNTKGRKRKAPQHEQPEAQHEQTPAEKALEKKHDNHFKQFPVVVTTYDLIIRDRSKLDKIPWGYIVVDEGHRLKNMDCALVREVKRYQSAGRMILTGTPLHNNLAELWSLLNFILPDIFSDLDAFQEWQVILQLSLRFLTFIGRFSLPRMSAQLQSERMSQFVSTMHTILKPFLLRRVKADVLGNALPPKKNYVLYAKLSEAQKEAYEAVLSGDLRSWVAGGAASALKEPQEPVTEVDLDSPRKLRARGSKGKQAIDPVELERKRAEEAAAFARKRVAKHVNNMHLQNTVMQLRKVCSHPFLFARGDDDQWGMTQRLTPTELAARETALLNASGKMLLLDRLLGELFRRGHKVLLFSQFTTMLDILEDWAVDMKGWKICRIDGDTPPLERRDQMDIFQNGGDAPDAPKLFLLSTRSGGLGVNLTAADTVIFYDQDWNPQMDIQAQDRAHRIGQTKPVLIFRLITALTVEEKIMQKAGEKRKLEALVIAKGKFKMPTHEGAAKEHKTSMAEMAAELLRLTAETDVDNVLHAGDVVLSDADMDALLDRSPEVFAGRGEGWQSGSGQKDTNGKSAFAVFEPAVDESGEGMGVGVGLEGIMGETESSDDDEESE
ncbi:SNF2 family DNA-dependent ATPase [Mycena indigotica]|uniref:SNF2 family DNA-dependent ATPase n=1 Tax=Mycena indigotica TaxID=2126181 RepID=A0A8H6VQZ1_9AGAR|nr:SNF2 family DNA-dependent ATPase [Mycena indigotica]KAF7290807.1 SNF2 family DNA-dependent ATPase [Mycena indigotica]